MQNSEPRARPKAVLVSGLPGAGKSYWLRRAGEKEDALDIADYYALSHVHNSKQAWAALVADLKATLKRGEDVYVEGLLFENTPSYARVVNCLRRLGVEYELVFIDTPWRTCIQRIDEDWRCGKDSAERTRARKEIVYAVATEFRLRLQRDTATAIYNGSDDNQVSLAFKDLFKNL